MNLQGAGSSELSNQPCRWTLDLTILEKIWFHYVRMVGVRVGSYFFFVWCMYRNCPLMLFYNFKNCLQRLCPSSRPIMHTPLLCSLSFSTGNVPPLNWLSMSHLYFLFNKSYYLPGSLLSKDFIWTLPWTLLICMYVLWTFYRTLPRARDYLPYSSACAIHAVPRT